MAGSIQVAIPHAMQYDISYEDGNVVLVAGSASFCVHRSVLSQHSPVFRDLFTVPQPPNVILQEKCPVVHLPDDPTHVRYLLRALYDRSFFNDMHWLPNFAEAAAGILVLAHKYDIRHLYDEAIHRVYTAYPRTFADMNAMRCFHLEHFNADDHAGLIFLINVAQRLPTSELAGFLPLAFYICCQVNPGVLVNGVYRSDGTREKLSHDDLQRCISGKEGLMGANTVGTLCLRPRKENVSHLCTTNDACHSALVGMVDDALEGDIFASCDALTNIDGWIEERALAQKLCAFCTEHLKRRHEVERQVVWDDLADCFGLTFKTN
ncbi:uncharacterized protein FIBRA_03418 [Fibroporia radiculosa]|uniref:BTB domain-containing protein n=1 Tax=Fibroporia radiculosa TaxID=599839 RepID=J4G5E3_9APHY|nr:uncharacterized protein FIBRA_03418 [Fibroporia radiculosa]CCM01368.1 predicted protein [Fibroporia radiculosa]